MRSLSKILYYKWLGFRTSRILFHQYVGFVLELSGLGLLAATLLPYLPYLPYLLPLIWAVCVTLMLLTLPLVWMIDFWFHGPRRSI
jgi:hypothetical protein